eukprot:scaffold2021_cov314-Chaetoceros_neogracile.AAC.4
MPSELLPLPLESWIQSRILHESDVIREEARSVLDGNFNALSTSTLLGSNVAFSITMPITMKLATVHTHTLYVPIKMAMP